MRTPRIHRLAALAILSFSGPAQSSAQERPDLAATPLPVRREPAGATLFTTLPSAQTGVTMVNAYADPRMWGDRYDEFAFGSIGTGVAIGDYDGDGRPDVYLVGKSDRSRLYRNLGGWRFQDVTDAAGLDDAGAVWKQGATFADVDNDGDLDLYVCRSAEPNLLYLNQGDGTFREGAKAAGLDLIDASVMATFQDYDRDGWLDVYVQTSLLDPQRSPRGQRDHLYRNRGDGTFEDVTERAGLFGQTQGHSATWWDHDEDGWPDLYVANDFVTPDQLYRNARNGTFLNVLDAAVPYFPYFSMGADLGDVNNDGRLDFFVADMLPTSREQNMRGMLNMQAKMAPELPPAAAAQYMRNMLYVSTGTGRMIEAARMAGLAATDWTWSVRFEDLDEDGKVDLHVTNGMVRDFFDADSLARIGRVDQQEGRRLVRAAPELRERNLAFRNRGDLQFESVGPAWGLDQLGISFGTASGDLDGDGDPDLVFSNYQGEAALCRNDTTGSHRVVITLRGTASNRFGVGARVRIESAAGVQVRQLSLARGYLSSSEPVAHFGLGADTTITRLTIFWPSGRTQQIENLAADYRYVVTEPAADAPTGNERLEPQFTEVSQQAGLAIAVQEKTTDEFAAQRLLPLRQQSAGPALAIADLDGDGADDLTLGGVAGQPLQVLQKIGRQYLPGGNPALAETSEVADAGVLVFEANGDGNPDLLIAKGGVNRPAGDSIYQPRLLFGRGSTYFAAAPAEALPQMPVSAGPVVAGDFDRDGKLDVFVGGRVVPGAYTTTPRSVLLANEGGRFTDVTDKLAPGLAQAGHVQAALWTDVDQDGWLDLVVAAHWSGVQCWRNQAGRGFENASAELGFTAAGAGWWNSLAAADFNGDGHLDYAVGNLGLNTRYQPTPAEPVTWFAGVFEPNGASAILEAEMIGGRALPLRGRDQVMAALPSLRRRIPTYAAYAKASLDEIVGAEGLASARRLQMTEARSGVFLSTVAGGRTTFVFHPLPRVAQIAPIFGLVAGDFDGDGRADLYAVNNTHAPHPEIGRFAGGLSQLLRGDGGGGFEAVAPERSGLSVPGEARGLALTDVDEDGWGDFLVSRQHATLLAFRNGRAAGKQAFTVQLTGPADNPTAVGACVTVTSQGNVPQVAEIYAGGGYLSQSSASGFFGYPENDPPRDIRVRWPDGTTTVHAFKAGDTKVRLAMPVR